MKLMLFFFATVLWIMSCTLTDQRARMTAENSSAVNKKNEDVSAKQNVEMTSPFVAENRSTVITSPKVFLQNEAEKNPNLYYADVISVLKARDASSKEELSFWKEALVKASDTTFEEAFRSYIFSSLKKTKEKMSWAILLKLLRSDILLFRPYLDRDLVVSKTSFEKILKQLTKQNPSMIENIITDLPVNSIDISQLAFDRFPSSDPLALSLNRSFCEDRELFPNKYLTKWGKWQDSLRKELSYYWAGLSALCQKDYASAKELFEKSIKEAGTNSILKIANLWRLVEVARLTFDREYSAEVYARLATIWIENKKLSPESFGLTQSEFLKRRIDDILSAGRAFSLIGNYEHAKIFTNKALGFLDDIFKDAKLFKETQRNRWADLKAEAYHLLAFRVSFEKKELPKAISATRVALEIPGLSGEWQDRLRWFLGFYEFQQKNYAAAIKLWTLLKSSTKDLATKTRASFWLAAGFDVLKDKESARKELLSISERSPFSFYSYTAPQLAKISWPKDRCLICTKRQAIQQAYIEQKDLASVIAQPSFKEISGKNEFARAITLISIKEFAFAQVELKALEKSLKQKSIFRFVDTPTLNLLIKLYSFAGDHESAIRLLSDLSEKVEGFWAKNIDLIPNYFPMPYADTVKHFALQNNLKPGIIWGVARQESLFNLNAQSPVGALGFLQLMPQAAVNLGAQGSGVEISEKLKTVEFNVGLGSSYLKELLKRYKNESPQAFASYNGGEFAVDRWIATRKGLSSLEWIEAISFEETRNYVKAVLRNLDVYSIVENSPL